MIYKIAYLYLFDENPTVPYPNLVQVTLTVDTANL